MADSGFWQELAEKFRAIPDPVGLLGVDWEQVAGSGLPYKWSLRTNRVIGNSRTVRVQFEALARRAASEIANPSARDLLDVWFDALNKDIATDAFERIEEDIDGKSRILLKGRINRICDASADFCNILESRAIVAENANAIKMPDANFWRDLADKFRLADPYGFVSAEWVISAGHSLAHWDVIGKEPARTEVEALARRAGIAIDSGSDSLYVWLESLKAHKINFTSQGSGIVTDESGTTVGYHHYGTISAVAEASMQLCHRWESTILERGRIATLRKDNASSTATIPLGHYSPASDSEPSKMTPGETVLPIRTRQNFFPRRAEWLQQRLRERSWDQNTPRGFGGPDRKTVLRILDGHPSSEESLRKIVLALNKKNIGKKIELLDIPND